MEPLSTAKVVLTWLGAMPCDSDSGWLKKIASITCGFFAFVAQMCGLVACLSFVIKFISTKLEQSMFAISVSLAYLSLMYMILVALYLRPQMLAIFVELSEIHANSKAKEMSLLYENV